MISMAHTGHASAWQQDWAPQVGDRCEHEEHRMRLSPKALVGANWLPDVRQCMIADSWQDPPAAAGVARVGC